MYYCAPTRKASGWQRIALGDARYHDIALPLSPSLPLCLSRGKEAGFSFESVRSGLCQLGSLFAATPSCRIGIQQRLHNSSSSASDLPPSLSVAGCCVIGATRRSGGRFAANSIIALIVCAPFIVRGWNSGTDRPRFAVLSPLWSGLSIA